jgi:hypothetical protein
MRTSTRHDLPEFVQKKCALSLWAALRPTVPNKNSFSDTESPSQVSARWTYYWAGSLVIQHIFSLSRPRTPSQEAQDYSKRSIQEIATVEKARKGYSDR